MSRTDFTVVRDWTAENSKILDLGCGDGTLLAKLRDTRNVNGYGIEINHDNIAECIEKGVNVIEQNLDKGLGNLADKSFDYVIMTQALQAVEKPHFVLSEMLRVGREAIITFPNFGYWQVRSYLFFKGRMPVSKRLPYQWYDTPNIHLCTVRDFEVFCRDNGYEILERMVLNENLETNWLTQHIPNIFGELAIYRVTEK